MRVPRTLYIIADGGRVRYIERIGPNHFKTFRKFVSAHIHADNGERGPSVQTVCRALGCRPDRDGWFCAFSDTAAHPRGRDAGSSTALQCAVIPVPLAVLSPLPHWVNPMLRWPMEIKSSLGSCNRNCRTAGRKPRSLRPF